MSEYTPTTEEVRERYSRDEWDVDEEEADPRRKAFDRWFASEIEKAERRGEVLATARRIASENAELMRRLA